MKRRPRRVSHPDEPATAPQIAYVAGLTLQRGPTVSHMVDRVVAAALGLLSRAQVSDLIAALLDTPLPKTCPTCGLEAGYGAPGTCQCGRRWS